MGLGVVVGSFKTIDEFAIEAELRHNGVKVGPEDAVKGLIYV